MSFVYAFFHTHTLSSLWASWVKAIIPRHPAADVRVQIFLLFSTCCLTNFKWIHWMRCCSFPMTNHYSLSSSPPFIPSRLRGWCLGFPSSNTAAKRRQSCLFTKKQKYRCSNLSTSKSFAADTCSDCGAVTSFHRAPKKLKTQTDWRPGWTLMAMAPSGNELRLTAQMRNVNI